MFCKNCGNRVPDGAAFCPSCGAATDPEGPAVTAGRSNTSGTGSEAVLPPEIKGWNWGAFLLTWIWGLGNGVYIALLALLALVPVVGWVIALIVAVFLGARGNELAWRKKRWVDVDHFKDVQRKWAIAGAIVVAVVVVFTVFAIAGGEGPATF
jgi:hypothetical protein